MLILPEGYHRVPSVGFLQKNILEVINKLLDHAPEYTQLMKSHFVEWALDLLLLCHNETIKFTSTPAITRSPITTPEEHIVKGCCFCGC